MTENDADAARARPLISICVPVLNEEDNIGPFYARISPILDRLSDEFTFEILFTDNHSDDRTFERLAELSSKDARIRVIRFSRNFGFQRSILVNYINCRGIAAIQIDVDLQDPPELIPDFIRLWKQGYKVVYGIRRKRPDEQLWLRTGRKLFYKFIDSLSEDQLPHDAGDFRLIDQCILAELRAVTDQQPYLRGMIAAMGFNQIGIVYDRSARTSGQSKFTLKRLANLALDGILHHSTVPLRLATTFGVLMFAAAIAGTIYYLVARLLFRFDWPAGLASLHILILFSIGMNAILLGVIGEYIGRIFKNVKSMPLAIVESVIDPAPPHGQRDTPPTPASTRDVRPSATSSST